MKKKTLFFLSLVVCVILSGCREKKDDNMHESNETINSSIATTMNETTQQKETTISTEKTITTEKRVPGETIETTEETATEVECPTEPTTAREPETDTGETSTPVILPSENDESETERDNN